MLSENSPFLNLPITLDRKQAVFLDGMRHAVEIVDFSYTRLCDALTRLALGPSSTSNGSQFTHVFLDAWAFIDAVDRFRYLWERQPNSESLPERYSSTSVRAQLQTIRDVRNVSAHIAQNIDQIVSLNSSVLGSINWVTVLSQSPLKVKTYFIRPGIMRGSVKAQFAMPAGEVNFVHGTGSISLAAGKHEANLSGAYSTVCYIIKFAEKNLQALVRESAREQRFPVDMFGSAELDTGGS